MLHVYFFPPILSKAYDSHSYGTQRLYFSLLHPMNSTLKLHQLCSALQYSNGNYKLEEFSRSNGVHWTRLRAFIQWVLGVDNV